MCEFAMNDEMIMISVVDLLNSCILEACLLVADPDANTSVLLVNRAILAVYFCRTGATCHLNRHKRESRKESKNSSVAVSRQTLVLVAIRPIGMWTLLKYPPDHRLLSPPVSFFPDPLLTNRRADSFLCLE